MYKCSITACDEKNVFIGHIYEMGDTIEEAKDKASTRCQKLCEKQPVAYASVIVTDNDGNYVDSDEFTLRNGELDLSGEGNPRVGISIVELWEYLKERILPTVPKSSLLRINLITGTEAGLLRMILQRERLIST